MSDFGMAAFSVFFMQNPSFLARQAQMRSEQGRSNCETLFGMAEIPCDSQVRSMLDPVDPAVLQPAYEAMLQAMVQTDAIASFRRLGGRLLVALDGTEYFTSYKLSCTRCSHRTRSNGRTEHFHGMVSPLVVAPGHNMVLPLTPEFVVPQDGHEKQDCEPRAAARWLRKHKDWLAPHRPVFLGDDLYSRQPLCQEVLASGADFLFVALPTTHKLVFEYLDGALEQPPTLQVRQKHPTSGKLEAVHTFRWMLDVPLRDGKDALRVNVIEMTSVGPKGEVKYRNSWVTSLPVTAANVAEIALCGRARWKIENEGFNCLKTKGYNLEHNFGHGKQHLASLLASLNLLAFGFHTVCLATDERWRDARAVHGSARAFYAMMHSATWLLLFPSWDALLSTLKTARPPPAPRRKGLQPCHHP
jgi:hypothetical protein